MSYGRASGFSLDLSLICSRLKLATSLINARHVSDTYALEACDSAADRGSAAPAAGSRDDAAEDASDESDDRAERDDAREREAASRLERVWKGSTAPTKLSEARGLETRPVAEEEC